MWLQVIFFQKCKQPHSPNFRVFLKTSRNSDCCPMLKYSCVCDYGSRGNFRKMNYSKHKYSTVLLDKLIPLDVVKSSTSVIVKYNQECCIINEKISYIVSGPDCFVWSNKFSLKYCFSTFVSVCSTILLYTRPGFKLLSCFYTHIKQCSCSCGIKHQITVIAGKNLSLWRSRCVPMPRSVLRHWHLGTNFAISSSNTILCRYLWRTFSSSSEAYSVKF